jgi:hypothetical protein
MSAIVTVILLMAMIMAFHKHTDIGGRGDLTDRKPEGPMIGSPTTPHSDTYREKGCPALPEAEPGRRLIQIKNNCKETIWPGMIPAGASPPPKVRGSRLVIDLVPHESSPPIDLKPAHMTVGACTLMNGGPRVAVSKLQRQCIPRGFRSVASLSAHDP